MKFKIEYEFDGTCWAKSHFHGKLLFGCGETFQEARGRLVERLRLLQAGFEAGLHAAPEPEEIEV